MELAARRAGRAHAQLGQLQGSGYDAIARKFWAGARAGTGTAARNLRAIARACLLDLQPLALRTDARIESPRALAYVDPGGPGQPAQTPAGAWRKTVRGDGYRDCLHFCSPGPLRLVPALLQQMLQGCAAPV